MKTENESTTIDTERDETFEQSGMNDSFKQPSYKSSKPAIAGIMLMIVGGLSILMWLSLAAMDVSFIKNIIMPEIESMAPEYKTMSAEMIKQFFVICGTIGFFLSVFAILGGIMSIRRRMWGIALAGGILGLFTIGPIFLSSILALIAIILIATSKKEFQ